MEFIYNFWVEMCPFFNGFEFMYVFFTALTLYVLLYIVIVLPSQLLIGGTSKLWND